MSIDLDLYPHQRDSLAKMKNGCILAGDVGTGKSRVAVAYYCKVEADADVFVITTAKKRETLDWQKEFARAGIGRHLNATVGGALTVDSWNQIEKYEDVVGAFFIFDESRLGGSGPWSKSFLKIAKNNRWILLSATPADVWLDYCSVFIANGFYKNRTEFKREHVVYNSYAKFPKVERYVGVGKLIRQRNAIIVPMPYSRVTTRHEEYITVDYDKELYKKVVDERWNIFKERPLRDAGELFSAMRRLVNSSPSRMDAVTKLIQSNPKLIVFYGFDYELDTLRLLANFTTVGELNGHRHDPLPCGDSWVYLVQYAAGCEGWDCTETDTMVFYSLPYSYRMYYQAHGRIDRLNTEYRELYYYNLVSNSVIDRVIVDCLRKKKDFNESAFIKGQLSTN